MIWFEIETKKKGSNASQNEDVLRNCVYNSSSSNDATYFEMRHRTHSRSQEINRFLFAVAVVFGFVVVVICIAQSALAFFGGNINSMAI